MATAVDYGITFGYGAQDGYYYKDPKGTVGRYHRGNDRPCPPGTAIVIGQYTIGWTGATGIVSGPHLHTQACTAGKQWADDLNPAPYEFKYGTVVQAGWHSQFGNYVMIRVGNVDITYAHLSKINVKANQILAAPAAPANQGGVEVANRGLVDRLYNGLLFRAGDEGGLNNYTGKNVEFVVSDMLGSQERKNLENQINGTKQQVANLENIRNQQQAVINDLTAKLQSSELSAAEKTTALNEAIGKFQACTTELDKSKQSLLDLFAEKQKAVEQAIAANQPTLAKAPGIFFKLLAQTLNTVQSKFKKK